MKRGWRDWIVDVCIVVCVLAFLGGLAILAVDAYSHL